jgi:flavorubredoxin
MATRVDEIADGVFRISTWVAEVAPPAGFTFNQYLIRADEPLLFHCGPRGMFSPVSAAVAGVLPVESLRWISFGHIESDECGAMNQWLAAAPEAQVVHGMTACMVSLNDLADRPPRALADGERLDLGGKTVVWIDTPHVPHAWESGLMFEESTATLMCGDLFTQVGDGLPAVTSEDITPLAIRTEEGFHASALTAATGATIRALKRFAPARLAVMHGACFEGDCAGALDRLADYYDQAHTAAMAG